MTMKVNPPEGLMDADDPISRRMAGVPVAEEQPVYEEAPSEAQDEWRPVGTVGEPDERAPLIPPPPEGEVELPGGYLDEMGVLVKTARVRELTGEDEEALAPYNPEKNIAEYVTQLVLRGTVSIGQHPMTHDLARRLLMGDRDALVLGIRKVTFGNEIPIQVRCADCDVESDVFFDIDTDIPVRSLKDPSQRLFEVKLRHGRKAKIALPNGEVHERIAASKLNIAEINTLMLSMCVKEINGDTMITPESVKKLGIEDRKNLINFVMENQPGPRMDVKAPCHRCGREYPVALPIGVLFR